MLLFVLEAPLDGGLDHYVFEWLAVFELWKISWGEFLDGRSPTKTVM